MFSIYPPDTSRATIKIKRCQCLLVLAALFLSVLCGCSGTEEARYVVPRDIYELSLETTEFVVDTFEYSDDEIEVGSRLTRQDLQYKVNDSLVLCMGNPVNTSMLTLEEVYDYGDNGVLREYIESTGNYKILVADKDGQQYLVALLTLSKYMQTYRGVRNGLTEEALDILMGGNVFVTEEASRQINRIYTIDKYKLIITMRDGIVRSVQMISGVY